MELGLGRVSSPTNKLVKDYQEIIRVKDVVLKEDSSTRNPTFILELEEIEKVSDISNINYLHWFQTGRYYFVTDIRFLKGKLIEIDCRCDVLMTFRTDILESVQYTARSGNKYSTLLADDYYTVLNNYNINYSKIADTPIPEGNYHWVLTTATS